MSVIAIWGYGGYGLTNGHMMQYKRKAIRFINRLQVIDNLPSFRSFGQELVNIRRFW